MSRPRTETAGRHYDLIAIGSGPAGRSAAVQASRLGARVAIVERAARVGGSATTAGILRSQALQIAILEAVGSGGGFRRGNDRPSITDLLWRAPQAIEHEQDAAYDELRRGRIEVLTGTASFLGPHDLEVSSEAQTRRVTADRYVIAVGATATRPPGMDFDDRTVLDSKGIRHLREFPETLTIVGSGVAGLEYASMASALGTKVTLIERRARILDVVDREIADALEYHLRGAGVDFRLGRHAAAVERPPGGGAVAHLDSGERIPADVLIHTAGRDGATAGLNLPAAGLYADDRGRIAVDGAFRTAQPHIFAAGDVLGFPKLTSISAEQGRLAALAALGRPSPHEATPCTINTIPEIAFVGRSEPELARDGTPYVVGRGAYRGLTRGRIAGDRTGFLKLLVHSEERHVLGVHIFGSSAAELINIGKTAMVAGLPVDSLATAAFHVPSYADAYRVAALDAVSRLREIGEAPVSHAA